MTPHSPIDEPRGIARVSIASAQDAPAAVVAALAMLGDAGSTAPDAIVLLPPPPISSDVRAAVRTLAGAHPAVARPRGQLAALVSGQPEWRSVVLPAGARRFDQVSVPAKLLDRPLLVACPWPIERRSPTPLGLLAAFAHPRLRLAALAGGDPGAIAELAAPLRPSLVLLAGAPDGRPVVALTADVIAAELVARALRPSPPDAPGPWEHAAVQRATELDLGTRTPTAIEIVTAGAHAGFLARTIRPRIGIE